MLRQPPIADYAFIGNGHASALVSRGGSVDWCCMPRLDSASCFGRLLDWQRGGHCSLSPTAPGTTSERAYLDDTLVLETRLASEDGEARVLDCLTMDDDGRWELLRVAEGLRGSLELALEIVPRLDYGALAPWLRRHDARVCSATGGDDALVVTGDLELEPGEHEIAARFTVGEGERVRLSIGFAAPDELDRDPPAAVGGDELDRRVEATIERWRACAAEAWPDGPRRDALVRSATVLKALANPRTGAIAAAATTSLPEGPGGELNWDYRYSWIRDSAFSVRSLTEVGFRGEADAFRRFVERSAAGSVDGLQIMYGMGGERRLAETTLDALEGYRGARPVRIGNAASEQLQLDVYGHLLSLAWRWHERGHAPDDDYWRFLAEVVEAAARRWREPDRGIWEIRGEPRHFVHSKAMCWAALDRGVRLAEDCGREAPLERWGTERDAVRRAIERDGYDDG